MVPIVLAAFLCSSIAQGVSPDAVEVRLRPELEQPLRFLVAQDIHTQAKMGSVEFSMKLLLEMEMRLSFRGEEQGDHLFDLFFERTWGTIEASPGGRTEFDSKDGKSEYPGLFNPKVLQIKMLAGKTIQLAVTPGGLVERVQGYAEIYAGTSIERELRGGGELLTDESFRDDAQMLFAMLPSAAVRKSEGWEIPFPMSVFENEIIFQPRYELIDATEEMVRWTCLTVGESKEPTEAGSKDPEAGAGGPRAFVTTADVQDASLSGEAVVSRKDGLPLRQSVEIVLEIRVPSPVSADLIPFVLTQRVETRRLDDRGEDG